MIGSSSEGVRYEAGGEEIARTPTQSEVRADAPTPEPVGSVDYERLEQLLAERAHELQALRSELSLARRLLREASSRFEESALAAAEAIPLELRAQRERAVARAIEAEVARAELALRLDEALGHVATAAGELRAPSGENLELAYARLLGTERGLQAALAESEEARDQACARFVVLEHDFEQRGRRAHELERALAEAREQLELEAVRARSIEHALEAAHGAELEVLHAERAGLKAREAEAERAFASQRENHDAGERLAHEIENRRELGSELQRAVAEQMVLREELARVQADRAALAQQLEHMRGFENARVDTVSAERDSARRESAAKREWAAGMAEALRDARALLKELASALELTSAGTTTASFEPGDEGSQPPPGRSSVPPGIEALEGLEERVTLRDQRITELSSQLARDRGRLANAAQLLTQLRDHEAGAGLSAGDVDAVLALLVGR